MIRLSMAHAIWLATGTTLVIVATGFALGSAFHAGIVGFWS